MKILNSESFGQELLLDTDTKDMVASVKHLNAIYNKNSLILDELETMKRTMKKGLDEVVKANRRLDPTYTPPHEGLGEWRKVEPYDPDDHRPLVKSDIEQALKKLDII